MEVVHDHNIATTRLCGCRNSYNVKTFKFGFSLTTKGPWHISFCVNVAVLSHEKCSITTTDSDWQVFYQFFTARRVCIARTMMSRKSVRHVCPPVTRQYCIVTSKYIFTILPFCVFFVANIMAIFRRELPKRVIKFRWGMKNRDYELSLYWSTLC